MSTTQMNRDHLRDALVMTKSEFFEAYSHKGIVQETLVYEAASRYLKIISAKTDPEPI